ncbi:Sec-independent protein translocase protein TatB [Vibrio sp. Isolate25]|uniref:Sec-independent protein translocase protein TatB n=1 Tax=Vibrio TaxID=662 RepID=UPI001EFCEBB8|nr:MULTISPECIES: Sec-independent protein translocase protein TatB [Vibrio]MCG9598960.1 Sec-independent protein translocase protein TatB [Vibrio sp. Isolate25]USD32502.1 Sec-independent protein translocase subunit TatB [Vibrio sp. SCSIO 43186]USD45544.1 Sec-independent protein translocase subunit TatB [Vibrio sp. SCSIO 43145]USD69627.1 Sec-independent protein translocase subunit TatB [Vibrio sp. SCSIO 43139]USD97318.1 twin-arginine translocase subunit TatB [Vibrio coralliilyticus]
MFDIGFWELVLISVVGLVVLGPERLPHAIRSVSRFVGAAKKMANSVKDELSHELKVQELQENLRKAEKMGMEDLSPELKSSVEELKQAAQDVQRPYASKSDSAPQGAETEADKVQSIPDANDSVAAVETLDTQAAPQADKKAE